MNLWYWKQAMVVFVAFSFMASAIYCLNDLRDIESDRAHPIKQKRPLASGAVKPMQAIALMVILIALSLGLCRFLPHDSIVKVLLILLFYLVTNIAYCYGLKRYAIIDVFIVSFGFVLRLAAGGVACSIWLSPWIVLMTFLLALFLAFAKRRDDVVLYEEQGIVVRKNILRYNLQFMNQVLGLIGAIAIVCYIMYTVSPDVEHRFGNQYVYITAIFVIAAILRYLQVAIVDLKSGSPTKVLMRDRFIQACLMLWIATFAVILYL